MGIYEDFGTFTCGGYPGSKFYLEQDADTFAKWGVDMVKLDGCYTNIEDMDYGKKEMRSGMILFVLILYVPFNTLSVMSCRVFLC